MKIGVVSDSPAITTGYGVVTDQCCRALLDAGHTVTCFGFKDCESNPYRQDYPCPVEPIDPFERWHPKLRAFVARERLDTLWIYMDMYNLEELFAALGDTAVPPMSLYAIFDGLPAYDRLLGLLRAFRTIVVTTDPAAAYLERQGHAVHAVAPPGVDPLFFKPLDRDALRREAGLDSAFVIGAFGRNTERKQQPRLLLALQSLCRSEPTADLVVYFHCAPRGYWDLGDLAARWGVRERTLFASDEFDETFGLPLRRHAPASAGPAAGIPPSFGYVERLNVCDLVINVPHSGDFEQVLIEAPACGIPVAATDDGGIMRAALGPGWPLPAQACTMGNTGQSLHFVSVGGIEECVQTLRSEEVRRRAMVQEGRAYAAGHGWGSVRRAIVSAVEATVRV